MLDQPNPNLEKAKRELEEAAARHMRHEAALRPTLGCCTISASASGSGEQEVPGVEIDECRDIASSNHVKWRWVQGQC